MMVTERTGLRWIAAKLLKEGETPEAVRNILRSKATRSKDVPRIVADTMHKLRIEEPEFAAYEPPFVDTTGLVEWADGHWAEPRSAQIIREARARR
jgi:hypothetical protein